MPELHRETIKIQIDQGATRLEKHFGKKQSWTVRVISGIRAAVKPILLILGYRAAVCRDHLGSVRLEMFC